MYYHSLTGLGKRNTQPQPVQIILFYLWMEEKKKKHIENTCEHVKFTGQRQSLTKRSRPNHRTTAHFQSPSPHRHITKDLLTAVPLIWHLMFIYQEKITRQAKRQKTTSWWDRASIRTRYQRDVKIIRPGFLNNYD